jgi:alkylation response protein AidB-like acyl-CoA dehydrogenase
MVHNRRMSDEAQALLERLLRDDVRTIPWGDDIAAWWSRLLGDERAAGRPIDRAIVAGFRGDRCAGAFAGGYQAALRRLVPEGLPKDDIVSLCVTEPAGNSAKAIEARLTPRAGGYVLTGQKRWSTMAPLARMLLVAAHEGVDAHGLKRFKLVRVDADAPGLTIRPMPPTKFVPEVPHAELEFRDVVVRADAALPGDGYTAYVKRFRTIEDAHIKAAVLAYVLSVARRFDFPDSAKEELIAALVTMRTLALLDADAAETHVALAGALARDARLLARLDTEWNRVEPAERDRWRRDSAMFGAVAGQIREARRVRAWERLSG